MSEQAREQVEEHRARRLRRPVSATTPAPLARRLLAAAAGSTR